MNSFGANDRGSGSAAASVIIPAHNAEGFIAETIQSVLGQTFSDFEIVVIDDGSTDNTANMVKSIEDPRIRYVYQENAGQASARNVGVRESQGEFLAFLDADDLWEPNKLERQLCLFADHRVGLVYTGAAWIGSAGEHIASPVLSSYCGDVLRQLVEGNFITCSSVMLRRSILLRENLQFRSGRKGVEDWDLWLRLARCCRFAVVPDTLVRYRVHENGCSQDPQLMAASTATTLSDFETELRSMSQLGVDKVPMILNRLNRTRKMALLRYGHDCLSTARVKEGRGLFRRALARDALCIRAWWGLVKSYLPRTK